ncbi:hypothetical protein BDV96DRAFT_642229 [Lophiotrema nucula]|uniref:Uncharacterized protein n=1 Tax=Lophiotrema nucula TaxID=690887 RepID=A0A6A5ZLY6_9PLEO|nr:hypothetical protein BDV96DRAFT_642229 [Lophiotrema nucula]
MQFLTAVLFAARAMSLPVKQAQTTLNIGTGAVSKPFTPFVTLETVEVFETRPDEHTKRDGTLLKRDTIKIDVFADWQFSGRNETLDTYLDTCYVLGNGWSQAISSIRVPPGYACLFYGESSCSTKGSLLVSGTSASDLNPVQWNDVATCYICQKIQ